MNKILGLAPTDNEKKAQQREKRAQGIAAMGLVTRTGDRFRVATPTLRGRQAHYEVWRDASNKVRCSCLEFTEFAAQDPSFRCEHILAVKHTLLRKQPAAPAPANDKTAKATEPPAASVSDIAPQTETHAENDVIETVNEASTEFADTSLQDPFALDSEENAILGETERPMEQTTNQPKNNVVPLNFNTTLRNLRQQVDASLVKTREGWIDHNGQQHYVEYVEWHAVADILDRVAPAWSHAVRNINLIGDIVAVTAAITIDGVTREGIGTGFADSEVGIKKAEHDALKRAAVKFGIARELYQKESETIEREGQVPPQRNFSGTPQARTLGELVTPRQLGMIRALAREVGVEPDEECQVVLKCATEELSKRAASSFIDHLKGLAQHAETVQPQQLRRAS